MKKEDLLVDIARGEDSTRQFKANVKNSDSLASELAAFANSEGGTIFIGVADDNTVPGSRGRMSSGSTN
jgi:ATP-dependent DNA helicase RecG